MAKQKRENRTITIYFNDEATYHQLCQDGRAFIEFVVAFIMSLGFQLNHYCGCPGGFALTRHSHYSRVRLGGLVIWRLACKRCGAVFTILPHFVLRYSGVPPAVAKKALLATHGGLSLEWTATLLNVSPMAIYRLVCTFGRTALVRVLTRCQLPLPPYLLADEKHSHCLTEKVYLPTLVEGRVIWHVGYTEDKSAEAFEAAYAQFQQATRLIEPTYQPQGILTDGFESTRKSLHLLFPTTPLGNCLRHATHRISSKLKGVTQAMRDTFSQQFYDLFARQTRPQKNQFRALGQKLRRFAEKVGHRAGQANGERIQQWIARKKAGWYALFRNPDLPTTSALLDQAHNVLDRKLFMMKGFHHPEGNQHAFLVGLALLYNFVPYQRRAKNAGKCGVEVQGGKLPTPDWFLNFQILTSGGFW
ncbi:MAG: hypothetical protein U0401_11270 [Anaerolineae bacterium]